MYKIFFGIMFVFASIQVNADLIIDASGFKSAPDGCETTTIECWTKEKTDFSGYTNPDAVDIAAIMEYTGDLFDLYKSNVDGIDEYTYADSYMTAYSNDTADTADAAIAYYEGNSIECGDCFLLVKDGNHTPGWYLFDISEWDGTEMLTLTNFWDGGGSISHVSIVGSETVSVDETAIGYLFTTGLIGLGIVRRKRNKNVRRGTVGT